MFAEIAIGAVGDGRQIGEFGLRRWFVIRWAGVIAIVTRGFGDGIRSCGRPTIGWTVIGASGATRISQTLVDVPRDFHYRW